MSRITVLVVDDDPLILRLISANLKASKYNVLIAADGESALKMMDENLPDLVLLDIMIPGIDGIEVCQRIREWSEVAIIVISAKERMSSKVQLLDLGADDYIVKPFGVEELLARVRAVLRRKGNLNDGVANIPTFATGDIEVNFVTQQVTVDGKGIHLTPIEYDLLKHFALNSDKVLTHRYLLEKVWGGGFWDAKTYLRVYVRRLRHKIETDAHNPRYILTTPGVGYFLQSELQNEPEIASTKLTE